MSNSKNIDKVTEERDALHSAMHEFVSEITRLREKIDTLEKNACPACSCSKKQNSDDITV